MVPSQKVCTPIPLLSHPRLTIATCYLGYDADVVIWDSHPLALGATPQQVYIDGIAQLTDPNTLEKPETFQNLPKVPNWDKETNDTVNYDGLPPLHGWGMGKGGRFKIEGVRSMVIHEDETEDDTESLKTVFDDRDVLSTGAGRIVIIDDGRIICVQSPHESCTTTFDTSMEVINLRGGSLAPGLTTYGAPLGLVEIRLESSMNDGIVLDPLTADLPDFLKSAHDGGVIRAVDGLSFEGRNALYERPRFTLFTPFAHLVFLRNPGLHIDLVSQPPFHSQLQLVSSRAYQPHSALVHRTHLSMALYSLKKLRCT